MIFTVRMTDTHRILQARASEWATVRSAYRRPSSSLDRKLAHAIDGKDGAEVVRITFSLDEVGVLFDLGVL